MERRRKQLRCYQRCSLNSYLKCPKTQKLACCGFRLAHLNRSPSLVSNSAKYHGKLVRLSALYQEGGHGTILGDSNCVRIETQTAVLFHPLQSKEIEKVIADASGKSDWGDRALRIRVVGRLQKVTPTNNTNFLIDTAPLHFEVLFIEQALSLRSGLK
jgi:hypothetical protein